MFTEIIKPRFLETDALGHINNNTYGVWFEAARDDIFHIFMPKANIKEWNLIMAHSSFDFLKEVFWGKEVIIKTGISKLGNSSIELCHAVYQEGKLCTTGKCVLIHYDFTTKVAVRIPDNIRIELEKHLFMKPWSATLEELED
ncbi:acyl-CoA thioesterase [Arcobacter cloacae]|uniref:Thioesterase n=1 Tax=Arcobacter cloacae TaxID=1054034 RepID=A0A4Q0ZGN4_9BACT|nr:thioesterase family protein [Arcobacter cloacae]NCB12099.1 acyl-CoA thioesterase [Erysipelotrichia bacterium]QKF88563.1 thioesterase [Arcobacter cloacae]RXI41237.1 thioesterase [Arcobacter cloacae]RXJ85020.1 thioesterase [Arcobacter cloacae]